MEPLNKRLTYLTAKRNPFIDNIINCLLVSDYIDINIVRECNHFLTRAERDILSSK